MQDLMEKLQSILSTKEGQAQLNNIANMLNMSGKQSNNQTEQPQQNNSTNQNMNPFQQNKVNQQQGNESTPQANGFDMSSLAGLFSNLQGNQNNNQSNEASNNQQGNGFDMSQLAAMLSNMQGNGNTGEESQNQMPNIDINMIMGLQQIFSKMNVSDKNSQLLLALKPHFGEARRHKVDQAISMMRLMSILPALKDSGIFPSF